MASNKILKAGFGLGCVINKVEWWNRAPITRVVRGGEDVNRVIRGPRLESGPEDKRCNGRLLGFSRRAAGASELVARNSASASLAVISVALATPVRSAAFFATRPQARDPRFYIHRPSSSHPHSHKSP